MTNHATRFPFLRICLFFEQRRWQHAGYELNQDAMGELRSIVDKILERIRAGEGSK